MRVALLAINRLAWLAILCTVVEAIARQLTRTRPIAVLPEHPVWLAAIPIGALVVIAVAERRRTGRPPGARPALTAAVFAALFAAGLAMQLQVGARLQSDAFYYYAYLRSMAFDRDVNFMNDYRMLGQGDKPHLFEPTATGHAHSAWTIGPAIVWSPFFAAGHVAASRLAARGSAVATDGTSYPYRQAVVIAGLFYALVGAWFTLRFTRRFFDAGAAGVATTAVIGGSFLLWYAIVEPTMTHAPSMAVVAGFTWAWAATMDRRSVAGWAALGALAGFAGLIRWQNVLFAVLPAIEAARLLWRARANGGAGFAPSHGFGEGAILSAEARRAKAEAQGAEAASPPDAGGPVLGGLKPAPPNSREAGRRVLVGGAAFFVAAGVAFLPQMIAWKAIYGSYLAVSPIGPTIDLLRPHLVDVLFSSRNGLFAMSPILYVAAIGLAIFAARRPAIGVPIVIACGAMTWFNASIYDWWGSDGYGGRRFDGLIPLLAPGLAAACESGRALIARRPHLAAGALLAAAAVWNLTLMAAAQRGVVRLGEATAFRDVGAEQVRILHGWIGHPFSYPVNLWFAARNGLSPAAYDLLAAYRFLGDRARPYGQIDVGGGDEIYMGAGWHAPERDGDRTFRWASRDVVVLVPLDHAAPLDVHVRLRAFAPAGAPPQTMVLDLDGRVVATRPVPADWDTVIIPTDRGAWRAGVTRMRLRFAWAERPVDLGVGGDTRELAAAVDNIRVAARAEIAR